MDNNDTVRMDWLQAQIDPERQIENNGNFLLKIYGARGKSLRECIDNARESGETYTETPIGHIKTGGMNVPRV